MPNFFSKNYAAHKFQQQLQQFQQQQQQQQQPQQKQQLGQDKQLLCTYVQNNGGNSMGLFNNNGRFGTSSQIQHNGGPRLSEFRLHSDINDNMNRTTSIHAPQELVYTSYTFMPDEMGSLNQRKEEFQCSLPDEVACYGSDECIPKEAWCNNRVDCPDGSDESSCTCRQRLNDEQICDGYEDCPMGEDEIGCYGCDQFMYSCYQKRHDFINNNNSAVSMCFSRLEKCDGYLNCLNGRDELDCNRIISERNDFMVSSN